MLRTRVPGATHEPRGCHELVQRVHAGELFVYDPIEPTRALITRVQDILRSTLGWSQLPGPGQSCPLIAHERLPEIRAQLYAQEDLPVLAARVLHALGAPPQTLVDTPRLRVVSAGAEDLLEARPVFVAHRDTWYVCPQGQINGWIPVFDCPHEQSFAFYPEYFDTAVPNASEGFEYTRWMKEVGWHGRTKLEDYPAPTEAVTEATEVRLPTKAGELLLFASAHLHQTRPNTIVGSSRLSLDFRTVLPGGPAAPNADNHSLGAEDRVQEQFRSLQALLGAPA